MSYRFCFGASGSGKSRLLHNMILDQAQDALGGRVNPDSNYVIIVPDQYSMQTQKEIVSESPQKGILNIDVLSFGRLTHKIFEETGVSHRAVLDDMGKTLLLRRVAGQCEPDLKILRKSIHYPGMISEVKSVISEFMQYGIGAAEMELMQQYAGSRGQGALNARLCDLQILYTAFMKAKRDRFITNEEMLDLLAEAIPASEWVRRSTFVLDGFTGFTPVQYRVITALIRYSRDVIISLSLGKDDGPPIEKVCLNKNPGREDSLYYLTRKTVCDLEKLALKEGLVRGEDLYVSDPDEVPARFRNNPVLAHLEQNIFRYPTLPYEKETGGRIRIFETDTPEEEVRQICIEIKRLVLTEGYQYRDISVVCGDLDRCGTAFEKHAPRYGIPLYVDRTSSAGLNPLTEAIRSVLGIRAESYSYNSIFRYLRSGMSSLTREETDLLENYCLEHGIKGRRKWGLPFDAQTEHLRVRFLSEIEPVAGRVTDERIPPRTAAERTRQLYDFMVSLSMEEKMEEWSSRFSEEGDFVRAKQFSQLYRYVIDLLEQIHDLLGDEVISNKDYLELLEAGFEEIRLGTLPQETDRLLVGDIERTRVSQCRILFFTGVNDGNIPRGTSRGGLLSDLDREFLRSFGTELSPTPRQQMYQQRLYLYMNMTKPTDALYLSFARTTPEGGSLHPSYLIPMIRKLFPEAAVEHPQLRPAIEQLTGVNDSTVWLSGALRDYAQGKIQEGSQDANALKTTYGYIVRTGSIDNRKTLESLKGAAFKRYDPVMISPETAQALYGRSIMGGITRMETAAQCSLRHFLQYGLGLRERREFTVESLDTGSILHMSLDAFSHKLLKKGLTWNSFTKEEGEELSTEALNETAATYHDLLMYSTKRSESWLARMQKILDRSTDTLQYQLQRGDFVPEGYEFGFGPGGEADLITFPLSGGRSLKLTGRIDRLDLCREDGSVFVKILDYKSGSLDLDEDLMKRGIQLQLLMYMNAAMDYLAARNPGAEIVPSAMLYYRIIDPVIDGNNKGGEDSLQLIRESLRPTGMINSDPVSYRHLDRYVSGKSDVIPLKLKKDGDPGAGSSVYSAEGFKELTREVTDVVCRLAEDILDGKAEANPAAWKNDRTACDYCPYRSVCGFDLSIEGYNYRK